LLFGFAVPLEIALCRDAFENNQDCCDYWIFQITGEKSQVDIFKKYQKGSEFIRDDERSIMCGIECLLKMKGDKRVSAIGANHSYRTSNTDIPNPSLEIASLFMIQSMIGNTEHIHIIILKDDDGKRDAAIKKWAQESTDRSFGKKR